MELEVKPTTSWPLAHSAKYEAAGSAILTAPIVGTTTSFPLITLL